MPTTIRHLQDLPRLIAVFPLDGALLLPGGELPLNIFEPRYLNMIDDAMAQERVIGMIQTRGGGRDRPALVRIGCLGRITSFAETSDGRYMITLTGVCRFVAGEELGIKTPYRQVRADYDPFAGDLMRAEDEPAFERERFLLALKAYLNQRQLDVDWATAEAAPAQSLVNSLAMGLPFEPAEKQALLEASDLAERCQILTALLEIDAAADGDDEPSSLQ